MNTNANAIQALMQNPLILSIGPKLTAQLKAVAPDESPIEQLHTALEQLRGLRAACLRLLQAAEGMNDLHDDESRAEAYAAELAELDKAKDQARDALNLGIPPDEQARRSKAQPGAGSADPVDPLWSVLNSVRVALRFNQPSLVADLQALLPRINQVLDNAQTP